MEKVKHRNEKAQHEISKKNERNTYRPPFF